MSDRYVDYMCCHFLNTYDREVEITNEPANKISQREHVQCSKFRESREYLYEYLSKFVKASSSFSNNLVRNSFNASIHLLLYNLQNFENEQETIKIFLLGF